MKDINIAIIGHGFMGHEHETMLSDFEGIRLVGFSDMDPAQLEDVKEGLKRYGSNEELINDPEVDVVAAYFDYLTAALTMLREQTGYDRIRCITEHLHDAEYALFYSYPEVQINILQKCLIMSGKDAAVFDTIATQERSTWKASKGTVVFAVIPDVREMSPMRSILKRVKEQGAFLITLCSEARSDYERYSDIHIGFQGTKTSMDLYLFMVLINLIKADYGRRYIDPLVDDLYD